ncbi:DUF5694 domain-containing protein [Halobacillus sp. Marseille-Q1614]|uniref:DUF5694 domain-containing protein n=1 Tax=Halobacillus sp. Marseille-Q1614 TaxID=2709134 RepID=UPI0020C4EEB2|nr:DUF5694 domain-containing protein [Halobacillus sp. Marseille-Q1614]
MNSLPKPQILILGISHFAMDPDIVNHQKDNISAVVEALKEFQPTKVAVEKPFLIEEELQRKYHEYCSGQLIPAYDEVEQIAFPLAHHFEHSALFPVDEIVDMSNPALNQVFEWAKEHQPRLFQDILLVQQRLKEMEDDQTFLSTLKTINDPSYLKELQRVYMKLTRVGDRQHQVGVKWIKQWHERDLAIAANIARITEPEDRVLVLIGGDHVHLLSQFLKESQDFELIPSLKFIPQ